MSIKATCHTCNASYDFDNNPHGDGEDQCWSCAKLTAELCWAIGDTDKYDEIARLLKDAKVRNEIRSMLQG